MRDLFVIPLPKFTPECTNQGAGRQMSSPCSPSFYSPQNNTMCRPCLPDFSGHAFGHLPAVRQGGSKLKIESLLSIASPKPCVVWGVAIYCFYTPHPPPSPARGEGASVAIYCFSFVFFLTFTIVAKTPPLSSNGGAGRIVIKIRINKNPLRIMCRGFLFKLL